MPKQVIEDAWVTLNSVDLSNRVKKVSIVTNKRSPQQVTAMGDTWEDFLHVNIRGWKGSLEFYQDYSASSVFATLNGVLNSTSTTGVPIIVRPTTNARTTGNPEWQGSILLDGDFAQLEGSVGDVLMATFPFKGVSTLSFMTSSS